MSADIPPPDELRAVAVDPRNDDWVRGAQTQISCEDNGRGILAVALVMGVLLAPLLYAAVVTRATAIIAGACGVLLLMAGSLVLFVLDMRDRRKLSGGRRIAARVVSAGILSSGAPRRRMTYMVESEFVSPRTGETLAARLGGLPERLRRVKRGDSVWIAYLDDEHYEAL
jgi:hypothetical protein